MTERRLRKRQSEGYRKILWPTDFSRLAEAAIPHALRLAAGGDAELVVLHVFSPPATYAPAPVPASAWVTLNKDVREAAERQLRRAAAQVKADGGSVRVRTLLAQGSPFVQIPRVAKRLACDLIVLATHGRTGLRHILLGSVAENVVRYAHCPVLTVRPARRRK